MYCTRRGGDLASPSDKISYDFIVAESRRLLLAEALQNDATNQNVQPTTRRKVYWIGLRDTPVENVDNRPDAHSELFLQWLNRKQFDFVCVSL